MRAEPHVPDAGVREPKNQSPADVAQFSQLADVFESSAGSIAERVDAFPKFASRQALAKFLARYEIFKMALGVHGSIVECGVLHGGGLLTFAKLSSILEPVNHTRRVIGFDTFSGFPSVSEKDSGPDTSSHTRVGGLTGSQLAEVRQAVDLYDLNRPLNHIPKVELIEGDITVTAEQYVRDHPHLVVALLYLDLDLYEPTKAAVEAFIPRMPRGAVLAFDELNASIFPGETLAVIDTLGLRELRIQRFVFDPYVSYCVLD